MPYTYRHRDMVNIVPLILYLEAKKGRHCHRRAQVFKGSLGVEDQRSISSKPEDFFVPDTVFCDWYSLK
jgi:hypothetical protein